MSDEPKKDGDATPIPSTNITTTLLTPGGPGYKSTEFWLGLAMTLIGAWLISKDKDEIGAVLVAAGGLGYTGARALVKKAPRLVSALLLTLTLVGLTGCNSHQIDADATGPLIERVCNRHDELVRAHPPALSDGTTDQAKLATYLQSTALLREVVKAAQAPLPEDGASTQNGNPPPSRHGPCNWEDGRPCGCNPQQGNCAMPCDGCCPMGCWPAHGPGDPAQCPMGRWHAHDR